MLYVYGYVDKVSSYFWSGCFSWLGLYHLVTIKENLNAIHNNILDNSRLPALWYSVGEGLFQCDQCDIVGIGLNLE